MKNIFKPLSNLMVLVLLIGLLAGCGQTTDAPDAVEPKEPRPVPAEVQTVKDFVTGVAADYVLALNGEFGDNHAALIASQEGRDFAQYAEMKQTLDIFRIESGARYIYCLIPGDTSADDFHITVDGSMEEDDWLNPYPVEEQFISAMNGNPAAASSAWTDDDGMIIWSGFAPIYDSNQQIVAILGVDYPAPEMEDFPEWNRSTAQFIPD